MHIKMQETEFVMLSKPLVEQQMIQLKRAIGYCTNARSSFDPSVPLDAEPTETYPGASGFARATMAELLYQLEAHLLLS